MKIPKAIEILDDLLGEGPQFSPDDRREATKLGSEALKRVKKSRGQRLADFTELLPGEDKE